MNKNKINSRNIINIISILLFCLVIILVCGAVVLLTIKGFRAMSLMIRIIVALVVILVCVLTVRVVLVKLKFVKKWTLLMDDLYGMKNTYERDLYNRYNSLMAKYPLSVSQFESNCWRQIPPMPNYEIMEKALDIDIMEWERLEEEAKCMMAKK